MRGFLFGGLALIVLYTVLQPEAAGRVQTGTGLVVTAVRRFMSPQVAGIPQTGVPAKDRIIQGPQPPANRPPAPPPNTQPGR